MTIPSTPRRSTVYVGNGAATQYPFEFKAIDPSTVAVTVADGDNLAVAALQYGADFTVTLNPDQAAAPGGVVNYAGLPVGHRLVITSAVPLGQRTSISNQGAFHAKVLEGALDDLAMQIQQVAEQQSRAAVLPATYEGDPDEYLQGIVGTMDATAQAAAARLIGASDGAERVGFVQSGTGAVARTAQAKMSDSVSAEDYTTLAQAIAYCSENGRALELKDGAEYTLTSDVTIAGGLRIRGRGKIKLGKDVNGIVIEPPRTVASAITGFATATYPVSTGIEQSAALTVAAPSVFAANDVCMVRSSDAYPFNAGARRGELVKVTAVVGNTIHLAGALIDSYTTSAVLEKLNPAVVEIDGPEFTHDGDPLIPTSKTRFAAVTLIGCVAPRVRATFHDDLADGLRMHSCWMPDVDVRCYNPRNHAANALYGYGVSAYGACTRGMIRVMADNVRHAYTDGVWVSASDSIRNGRCVDMTVYDSIAANCTAASFDTHPGSLNTRFVNCGATFNQTNSDQPSRNLSYGFQDRAINTKFINCWTQRARTPFYFGGALENHGRDNTTEVIGGYFESVGSVTTAFNTLPTKTTPDNFKVIVRGAVLNGCAPIQAAQIAAVMRFIGAEISGDGTYGFALSDNTGGMEFFDCTFRRFTYFRLGRNNNSTLIGCRRISDAPNVEPLTIGEGSNVTIDDYYAEAPSYGFGQIIRAGQGGDAGPVTINLGTVRAKGLTGNVIGTNGTAALTVNNMNVRQAPAKKGATSGRPALLAGDIGFVYLDTTLSAAGKPIWWTGSGWTDATGTAV